VRLSEHEVAEALFVKGSTPVHQLRDLAHRDVVIVHTIGKQTNLPIVGHAVFSRMLVERAGPRSVRTLVLTRARDPIVEEIGRSYGVKFLDGAELVAAA
jgi:hypothetical protein